MIRRNSSLQIASVSTIPNCIKYHSHSLVNGRLVQQLALGQLVHHVLLLVVVRRQNAVQGGARDDVFAALGLRDDCVNVDDRLVVTRCLQERGVLVQPDLQKTTYCSIKIIYKSPYLVPTPTIVL